MKSKTKSKATIERDKQARVRRAARDARSDGDQLALLIERDAGGCKEADAIRQRLFKTAYPEPTLADDAEALEVLTARLKRNRPARKRRAVPASLM
jgi:hypothetical protein